MRVYEVSCQRKGSTCSSTLVFVAARTKKIAIKHMIDTCGVYKIDRPHVTAKLVKKVDAVIIDSWLVKFL